MANVLVVEANFRLPGNVVQLLEALTCMTTFWK